LQMNFRVLDENGRQLGTSRNLAELKNNLGSHTEKVFESENQEQYKTWSFGDLDEVMEIHRGGQTLVGYPALVDASDAVTLQVFESPDKAREMHAAGVRRLVSIIFRDRIRDLERSLGKDVVVAPLKDDVIGAALDRVF